MKDGKSNLIALATEIERQRHAKKDLVADTDKIEAVAERSADDRSNVISLKVGDTGKFPMRDLALVQAAERTRIPIKYVRLMLEQDPDLLAYNLNRWFKNTPERRMIRTLDGQARAFLSNSYQRIDNFDVANVVLPLFQELGGLQLRSAEVTENRLYIKASFPALRREVTASKRVGDIVEAGVMVTNSEVGLGAVVVSPYAYFLICENGAVRDGAKRWNHVGKKIGGEDVEYLSEATIKASDRVDLMVIRDTMRHALSTVSFEGYIDKLNGTTRRRIEGDPMKAIEVLAEKLILVESEQTSVLRHLIEGGDLSQYGLFNAVTRTAEDSASYDRATELETAGQDIIDLTEKDWKVIAQAA